MKCPDCAHTENPGWYVGLDETEKCSRCNGTAEVLDLVQPTWAPEERFKIAEDDPCNPCSEILIGHQHTNAIRPAGPDYQGYGEERGGYAVSGTEQTLVPAVPPAVMAVFDFITGMPGMATHKWNWGRSTATGVGGYFVSLIGCAFFRVTTLRDAHTMRDTFFQMRTNKNAHPPVAVAYLGYRFTIQRES